MRYLTIVIVFLFTTLAAQAQTKINYGAGLSFNGAGDLPGYNVQAGIKFKAKNRISYAVNLRHTNNARELGLYFIDPATGINANSSYRLISSGIQSEFIPTLNIIKEKAVNLNLGIGGLIRYQFSNDVTQLAFLYPTATGYPIPLVAIDIDNKKFKYFTLGYTALVEFNFKINSKSNIGISLNLQNDTYGNVIWNFPVTYSYKISDK